MSDNEQMKNGRSNSKSDFAVLSVGQAREMAVLLRNDNNALMEIKDCVLTQDDIRGDAEDFHNLAVVYTRDYDDYVSGFAIVEKGLRQYPNNIDLLADAIFYGSSAGEYDKCEEHAKKLESRPIALWNWRAFTFLVDYYLQKPDWEDLDQDKILDLLDDAVSYSEMAQAVLEGDAEVERGYLSEYKVRMARKRFYSASAAIYHRALNGLHEGSKEYDDTNNLLQEAEYHIKQEQDFAENALKKAIDNGKFAATSCCLRLADSLFEQQRFEETIEVCNKALGFAQSQPSARIGYFIYLIALSEDALIYQNENFSDEDQIRQVYRDYQAAYDCNNERRTERYRQNIIDRLAVLAAKSCSCFM